MLLAVGRQSLLWSISFPPNPWKVLATGQMLHHFY